MNMTPKKHQCPENGKAYFEVSINTVLYHVKEPWNLDVKHKYYFCNDPTCSIVYFRPDKFTLSKDQLRTKIGLKETSGEGLVCYCFGITRSQLQSNSGLRSFVIEQTKQSQCACAAHNPSGKCCLKEFPNDKQ